MSDLSVLDKLSI
jgi:hypothetical protein